MSGTDIVYGSCAGGSYFGRFCTLLQGRIKCKRPQSQYNLYQECGVLHLIAPCGVRCPVLWHSVCCAITAGGRMQSTVSGTVMTDARGYAYTGTGLFGLPQRFPWNLGRSLQTKSLFSAFVGADPNSTLSFGAVQIGQRQHKCDVQYWDRVCCYPNPTRKSSTDTDIAMLLPSETEHSTPYSDSAASSTEISLPRL
eukprot:894245-Rhodomonas_salina.2